MSDIDMAVNAVYAAYPGYDALVTELLAALHQASQCKGKRRHSKGRAFHDQIIMTAGRLYGVGFHFGQVAKKMDECSELESLEAVLEELHGAIVYLSAAAALVRERLEAGDTEMLGGAQCQSSWRKDV